VSAIDALLTVTPAQVQQIALLVLLDFMLRMVLASSNAQKVISQRMAIVMIAQNTVILAKMRKYVIYVQSTISLWLVIQDLVKVPTSVSQNVLQDFIKKMTGVFHAQPTVRLA